MRHFVATKKSTKTSSKPSSKPRFKRVPEREPLRAAAALISGKQKKPLPFAFVLDELESLSPEVKAMFGSHAVYAGEKILFVLYQKEDNARDTGLWIKTDYEHHESLR